MAECHELQHALAEAYTAREAELVRAIPPSTLCLRLRCHPSHENFLTDSPGLQVEEVATLRAHAGRGPPAGQGGRDGSSGGLSRTPRGQPPPRTLLQHHLRLDEAAAPAGLPVAAGHGVAARVRSVEVGAPRPPRGGIDTAAAREEEEKFLLRWAITLPAQVGTGAEGQEGQAGQAEGIAWVPVGVAAEDAEDSPNRRCRPTPQPPAHQWRRQGTRHRAGVDGKAQVEEAAGQVGDEAEPAGAAAEELPLKADETVQNERQGAMGQWGGVQSEAEGLDGQVTREEQGEAALEMQRQLQEQLQARRQQQQQQVRTSNWRCPLVLTEPARLEGMAKVATALAEAHVEVVDNYNDGDSLLLAEEARQLDEDRWVAMAAGYERDEVEHRLGQQVEDEEEAPAAAAATAVAIAVAVAPVAAVLENDVAEEDEENAEVDEERWQQVEPERRKRTQPASPPTTSVQYGDGAQAGAARSRLSSVDRVVGRAAGTSSPVPLAPSPVPASPASPLTSSPAPASPASLMTPNTKVRQLEEEGTALAERMMAEMGIQRARAVLFGADASPASSVADSDAGAGGGTPQWRRTPPAFAGIPGGAPSQARLRSRSAVPAGPDIAASGPPPLLKPAPPPLNSTVVEEAGLLPLRQVEEGRPPPPRSPMEHHVRPAPRSHEGATEGAPEGLLDELDPFGGRVGHLDAEGGGAGAGVRREGGESSGEEGFYDVQPEEAEAAAASGPSIEARRELRHFRWT